MGPGQSSGGDQGWHPQKNISFYVYKKKRFSAEKEWDLFCSMSATEMFTINWIENSFFVHIKHVFLDISIKRQFEINKCLLFIKSKTPPFI